MCVYRHMYSEPLFEIIFAQLYKKTEMLFYLFNNK